MMNQPKTLTDHTFNLTIECAQLSKHCRYLPILLLLIVIIGYAKPVIAEDVAITKTSISYGKLSKHLDDKQPGETVQQAIITPMLKNTSDKSTENTRQTTSLRMQVNGQDLRNITDHSYEDSHEFEIYDATTYLEDDVDGDGYYQTFSITFDADVYSHNEHYDSEVYALLYLRKEGEAWQHYFTTDNFIIHADSDEDEYQVITTLVDGYHAENYDVLIDLYEVGYQGIVATFSANDSNSLYALPLESSDYDQPYIETVEIHHGGSLSLVGFIIMLVSLMCRIFRLKKH